MNAASTSHQGAVAADALYHWLSELLFVQCLLDLRFASAGCLVRVVLSLLIVALRDVSKAQSHSLRLICPSAPQVEDAARIANAHEFITGFPQVPQLPACLLTPAS